jgi:hypothetical protein
LLYFLLEFDLKLFYSISLILFSFIYFFDDLIGLNFLWRILIQILSSVIIYFSFSFELFFIQFFLLVSLFFILTNSLNFQDGKDLNITRSINNIINEGKKFNFTIGMDEVPNYQGSLLAKNFKGIKNIGGIQTPTVFENTLTGFDEQIKHIDARDRIIK